MYYVKGECFRYPPIPIIGYADVRPKVKANDKVCGEFKEETP
jgi:hypothetical protein